MLAPQRIFPKTHLFLSIRGLGSEHNINQSEFKQGLRDVETSHMSCKNIFCVVYLLCEFIGSFWDTEFSDF